MLKQWTRPDCLPQPEPKRKPEKKPAAVIENETDEKTEVNDGE
jgi:hypothetical protein